MVVHIDQALVHARLSPEVAENRSSAVYGSGHDATNVAGTLTDGAHNAPLIADRSPLYNQAGSDFLSLNSLPRVHRTVKDDTVKCRVDDQVSVNDEA